MCGFVGFLGGCDAFNENASKSSLQAMSTAIYSRGPDDGGIWVDPINGLGLAHRRLSILDLSPSGHQPMVSVSGRYVLAFNGEIYNHLDLRLKLAKCGLLKGAANGWSGRSDTETLLAGFEVWGINETIKHSVGMFAMAIWDREGKLLTLTRDRMGEKPLYYGWQGAGKNRVFIFGSELKALKAHPVFHASIDRKSLAMLMRYSYIPAPHSIYEGIRKLEAGSLLSISLGTNSPEIASYWSVIAAAENGIENLFLGSPVEAADELEMLLKNSIRQQAIADVPVGAFLSGGVDSSTIAALMQANSSTPIRTFTVGFDQVGYNEAEYARSIAEYLGTNHTELYVTSKEAQGVISKIPEIYCEPFADSSQIPSFLISQLARKHVKVCLSGDGGDELFCGYNRYLATKNFSNILFRLPLGLRKRVAQFITLIPPDKIDILFNILQKFLHQKFRYSNLGDKFHKGAEVVAFSSLEDFYIKLVSHWQDPSSLVIGATESSSELSRLKLGFEGLDSVQKMMAMDMMSYLPDDILVKMDRATMAVSLEGRMPFLDHRVVDFSWRLPQSMKLRHGESKWILRQVLYRYVPKALIERPKMGFGVPIGLWLRGSLRDWAEELLTESRLKSEGFFEHEIVRKKWSEHLSGRRNWQFQLWNVLMFQAWLAENRA